MNIDDCDSMTFGLSRTLVSWKFCTVHTYCGDESRWRMLNFVNPNRQPRQVVSSRTKRKGCLNSEISLAPTTLRREDGCLQRQSR
jgi:hypothetical protein